MSDKAHRDQEQKAAEADVQHFKDDLGPFVIAAETTRMPMIFTDAKKPDNPIIYANDSFLKLTGYDRDELLAQSFNFLLADPTDRHVLNEIEAAFAGKERISAIATRTAPPSAPRSSSVRSRTRAASSLSVSSHWSTPPGTSRRASMPRC